MCCYLQYEVAASRGIDTLQGRLPGTHEKTKSGTMKAGADESEMMRDKISREKRALAPHTFSSASLPIAFIYVVLSSVTRRRQVMYSDLLCYLSK